MRITHNPGGSSRMRMKLVRRCVKGTIEDLKAADVADASVDLMISNCVVNLSPDKPAVLSEAHRALADGGEFYFSAGGRPPRALTFTFTFTFTFTIIQSITHHTPRAYRSIRLNSSVVYFVSLSHHPRGGNYIHAPRVFTIYTQTRVCVTFRVRAASCSRAI